MMNCYSMTTRWEFGHEVEKPKLCTSGWQSTTRMPMTTCMLAWHSTIRTSMTSSMLAWHFTMRTPATTSTECRAHFLGSVVVSSSSHTHMHRGSSLRHSSHLHIHVHVCGLFTLILPFYFLLHLPLLFLFLNYMMSLVNLHNSCNEGVDASDDLLLSTWDGQSGADWVEANLGDYSKSFLPKNTYLRSRPCANVASCYDPIKVRWNEHRQHSKHWKLRIDVLHQSFQEERNVVIMLGNKTVIKPEMHKKVQWKGAKTSIWDRWQNDEVYRASQLVHGCTDEWVKYLDYIAHFDISFDAPHWQSTI